MEPEIKNGSFFLSSSLPYFFFKPKIGESIVFKNNNKIIVKKISKIEKESYFTQGNNVSDSKKFGPIGKQEILGKVIWIF